MIFAFLILFGMSFYSSSSFISSSSSSSSNFLVLSSCSIRFLLILIFRPFLFLVPYTRCCLLNDIDRQLTCARGRSGPYTNPLYVPIPLITDGNRRPPYFCLFFNSIPYSFIYSKSDISRNLIHSIIIIFCRFALPIGLII